MPATPPTDIMHAPWMNEFLSGATGFVAGAQTAEPGHAAKTKDKFLAEWQKAAASKRVFLSFTSADIKAAHAAAQALHARGYVTFVFLNPGKPKPRYDATFTGKMFLEAGHHIVLDTQNARKSRGVWLEATLAREITGGPGKSPGQGGPRGSLSRGQTRGDGPPNKSRGAARGGAVAAGFDEQAFVDGVRNRWVVTENPATPGKLFVHREISGGMLVGLLYHVKIESDGSWTVYEPSGSRGAQSFGSRLGSIDRPPRVDIGSCNCQ
jgi:hypothetical protein